MSDRAAEDAEIARRRFAEDAALAAKRSREDEERQTQRGTQAAAFCSEREAQEADLMTRWKGKFAELMAELEEAVAAHEAAQALEAQRRKEEEARAREAAAREAALEAERAMRQTELAEDARRLAELAKLRLSVTPSVRSLSLVSAIHVAGAIRYASPVAGQPLRLSDRSWWKVLHLLEAEGLTPPLKATTQATDLFEAIDADRDGAVSTAEAGYVLSLLSNGTARERVDATCDAPGAPAGSGSVTRTAAMLQLQLCANARRHSGPQTAALLLSHPAADMKTLQPVPTKDALEQAISHLFGASANLSAERFRTWAATHALPSPLFAPLFRGA